MINLHDGLAKHLQACLNNGIVTPWMTKSRTVLIMKGSKKRGVVWKLLTQISGDEVYGHLERSSLLQNEEKGLWQRV